MLETKLRNDIIALMGREVVPAIGCTEPVAVALCVARATELLGCRPGHITVRLSGNMLKNAMGVGIPGTGMIGLPIAIALGMLVGRSAYGLEVLRDVTPQAVEEGRRYIAERRIDISLAEDAPDRLHIDVTVEGGGHTARAVITGAHTHFVRFERDGQETGAEKTDGESGACVEKGAAAGAGAAEARSCSAAPAAEDGAGAPSLNMRMVWDFATLSPLDELSFILEAKRLNKAAALKAFDGDYGHSLGATIRRSGLRYFGDTPLEHMIAYTSAACDARMAGAPIPVMSNSGSGNQGITATMPVVSFAEDMSATEEQTIRALALSHLTSIYIKQSLGRLSALCGCVVASTGASSGIVYLMGGGYEQVCAAVKNMVANLTGMLCDGAKPSCSMKVSSGVSTALMSAMLAMNGKCVTESEGIVADDVDVTIHNLTSIGREAMTETDRYVLHIMTHKC